MSLLATALKKSPTKLFFSLRPFCSNIDRSGSLDLESTPQVAHTFLRTRRVRIIFAIIFIEKPSTILYSRKTPTCIVPYPFTDDMLADFLNPTQALH